MRIPIPALCALLFSCGPSSQVYVAPGAAQLLAQRPYGLKAPASTAPAPLILVLHGYGGSGQEIADDLGLTALFAQETFWLATPDGTVGQNGGGFWNATTLGLPPYDEAYLSALIDDVLAHHTVDPKQVYVIGYSIGAFMAHRLACDLSPKVASIASLAGAVTTVPGQCMPGEPVSVLEVHGDQDQVITYDGGPFVGDPPMQSGPSAHDTVAVWARNDKCTGSLTATGQELDLVSSTAGAETKVEAYTGCPAGLDVQLWTMRGVGHSPDLQPGFAAAVWGFLTAHPKR